MFKGNKNRIPDRLFMQFCEFCGAPLGRVMESDGLPLMCGEGRCLEASGHTEDLRQRIEERVRSSESFDTTEDDGIPLFPTTY
jgi:hypothetical protein